MFRNRMLQTVISTVVSPNPEEPEALKMALEKAEETGAALVMATDPDSDRLAWQPVTETET